MKSHLEEKMGNEFKNKIQMKNKTSKIVVFFIWIFILFSTIIAMLHHYFVFNVTESYPIGLYRKIKPSYQNNELIILCPPLNDATAIAYERHYLKGGLCSRGYSYMIKKIAASPGDIVTVGKNGVFVNGREIENSKPKILDGQGRPMPVLTMQNYKLAEKEYFVVSDYNEYSFDSRYMGCIEKKSIKAGLMPVWIKF